MDALIPMRNFLRLFIGSILTFLLFTSILSGFSDFSVDNMVSELFDDIYDYADSKTQGDAIAKMKQNCDALEKAEEKGVNNLSVEIGKTKELCNDEEKKAQTMENCKNIELAEDEIPEDEFKDLMSTCKLFESGEFEKQCKIINTDKVDYEDVDFSKMGLVCKDYENGMIDDKGLFSSSVGSLVSEDNMNGKGAFPLVGLLSLFEFIKDTSLLFIALLSVILLLLYIGDTRELGVKIGTIICGVGGLIIFPYLLLKLFTYFVPTDTSFILGSLGKGNAMEVTGPALKVLIPLILLKSYTLPLVVLGFVMFILGFVIKKAVNYIYHKYYKRGDDKKKGLGDTGLLEDDETVEGYNKYFGNT